MKIEPQKGESQHLCPSPLPQHLFQLHTLAVDEEVVVGVRWGFSRRGTAHLTLRERKMDKQEKKRKIDSHQTNQQLIRSTRPEIQRQQTHRVGDAEVIGDVLVRQDRHWPQVMSALIMGRENILMRHLTRCYSWRTNSPSFQCWGRNCVLFPHLCGRTLFAVELCLCVVGT